MAEYNSTVITNNGINIFSSAVGGIGVVTFTNTKTGNGVYTGSENLKEFTSLKSEKETFGITAVTKVDNNTIKLRTEITNADTLVQYDIKEIGIYGKLDNGTEMLLGISTAIKPFQLPDKDTAPTTIITELYLQISNSGSISFNFSIPTGVYASVGDLEDHANNKTNPHSVTKTQIGLANVPNVTTNDQTPTFTVATSQSELVSGEKLTISFGKIAKAISILINHLANISNPHSVTKSQVGLSNVPNVVTNGQTPTFTIASVNSNLSSGETLAIAFGKIAKAISSLISHLANTSNPHSVTKSQVGLGNVTNTSDENKLVSNAQQDALNLKVNTSAIVESTAITESGKLMAGKTVAAEFTKINQSLSRKVDSINTDGNRIGIGWDGLTFIGQVTTEQSMHNYRLLRDLSTSNSIYGFGFDSDGLYFAVDHSKIYVQIRY